MFPRFHASFILTVLSATICASALADVVTFTNGAVIRGTFLGGDARTVRIEVNGQVQAYRISEVAHIQFGDVQAAGGAGVAAAAQQTAGALGVQAPTVAVPQIQAPVIAPPAVQAPTIAAPAIQAPAIQAPAVPAVQVPAVAVPQVQAPAVQAPKPKRGFLGFGKKKQEEPPPAQQAAAAPVAAPVAAPPAPVAATPPAPVAVAAPVAVPPPAAAATAPPASTPVGSAVAPPAPVAISAPPTPAMQQAPLGGKDGRTIPEGALLQVRMIDVIDTGMHKPGEVFRASLENELAAAGAVLVAKGSDVNIRLVQMPGSSAAAGPRYRLEAVSIRLGSRNLPISAEALPFVDLATLGTAWKDGMAKISLENDKVVTFRVSREFRIP